LKIRLDENIANRIARAVMEITQNRPGYEVSFVRHGDGSTDPDWIQKFAAEDGTAIVSGDYNILQHWPNLIAYTESGLISFFPPPPFQHLGAYSRAAFILRWWPAIIEKTKVSERGDRWRLPMQWGEVNHTKLEPIKDPRFDGPRADYDERPTTEATQENFNFQEPPPPGQ
jgi:PIN like domain